MEMAFGPTALIIHSLLVLLQRMFFYFSRIYVLGTSPRNARNNHTQHKYSRTSAN